MNPMGLAMGELKETAKAQAPLSHIRYNSSLIAI
jgi:hypothetical protein